MTWNSTSRSEGGFTLLEVLISIGLLAMLSLAVAMSTVSIFQTNAQLGASSLDSTSILLSLQTVEADLAQIYTPMLGAVAGKPEDRDKKGEFWSGPMRSDGFRRSRFKGSGEAVSFVANNHRRVEADVPESDFQAVRWQVERNKSGTFSLVRTGDWDAYRYEQDVAGTKKPEKITLLENLSSAKFQFYKRLDKKWEDSWDSEDLYAKEESLFPDLVKLKIEAPDPNNNANQLAWEIVVRPNQQLNYLDAKKRAELKQRFTE